jgi:hypothetical protein
MKELASGVGKTIILFAVIIAVIYLIYIAEFDPKKVETGFTNLITVSSIITGIVFAYLVTKIFQVKAEREQRKQRIDILADKLTSFRRVCHFMLSMHDFWRPKGDIEKFEGIYSQYSFNDFQSILYVDNPNPDPAVNEFWSGNQGFSPHKVMLYLAFKQIRNTGNKIELWFHSKTDRFDYTSEEIAEVYYEPANKIWYELKNEWKPSRYDLTGLQHNYYTEKILSLIHEINPNYKGKSLDNELLGELGTEFHENYLEEQFKLTKQNEADLPKTTKRLLFTQILILIFGVMGPLIFSMLRIETATAVIGLKFSVIAVVVLLTLYLLQIFNFARQEIKV